MEAFEAEAAELYAQQMDTEQVRHFANRLFEVEAATSEATVRHRREQVSGIVKLWNSPTIAPIAGTRWAAYNAVTEYLDHIVSAPPMDYAAIHAAHDVDEMPLSGTAQLVASSTSGERTAHLDMS